MKFSRTRAFTLWEILLIVVVISIGLLAIISLLTYGITYVQKSRQKIIAINMAREGMEAMYAIRDTNRRRWAWRKEQCWLKTNPLDPWLDLECPNDPWIESGYYVLDTEVLSGQRYFFLTWTFSGGVSLGNGIDTVDERYALCLSGGVWQACPWFSWTNAEWRYFREIRGYGLFAKDVALTGWQYMSCSSWLDYFTCGSPSAKEFRFCSKVMYVWYGTWEVELCGLLTNFAEK